MFAFGVSSQGVALSKARVTKLALVRFLSGVHPLMALELTSLPETLGADGTHKVPLARVDVLVSLQMAGALEGFAALLADVRLLLRVCDGMPLQVGEVKEDPRAQLAAQNPARAQVGGRLRRREGVQGVEGVKLARWEEGSDGRGRRRRRRSHGVGEVEVVVQREMLCVETREVKLGF